jgi:hypothetical protein
MAEVERSSLSMRDPPPGNGVGVAFFYAGDNFTYIVYGDGCDFELGAVFTVFFVYVVNSYEYTGGVFFSVFTSAMRGAICWGE